MAKLSTEDLLGQFKEMSLVELSDFVKAFEEAFDVTAAALELPVVAKLLLRKMNSPSSLRMQAHRRSPLLRKYARSTQALASRRQRISSMRLQQLCLRRQTRQPQTRRRQLSKQLARRSPLSSRSVKGPRYFGGGVFFFLSMAFVYTEDLSLLPTEMTTTLNSEFSIR
ncbi:MAG: hypothetical protein RLZZ35_667 [Actinomycetota bacterium]